MILSYKKNRFKRILNLKRLLIFLNLSEKLMSFELNFDVFNLQFCSSYMFVQRSPRVTLLKDWLACLILVLNDYVPDVVTIKALRTLCALETCVKNARRSTQMFHRYETA